MNHLFRGFWNACLAFAATIPCVCNGQLVINEFVANPNGKTGSIGLKETGVAHPDLPLFSDWLEIKNVSGSAVSLADYRLTDDEKLPAKWSFPSGMVVEAGEAVAVLADELDGQWDFVHTNFGLAANGEYLAIYDASGSVVDELVDYPRQVPTHSYGRDGLGVWSYFGTPSPGAENTGSTFSSISKKPSFNVQGGFHSSALSVSLAASEVAGIIHFTMNGRVPTQADPIYTAPLEITAATQIVSIRARTFVDGEIPSTVASRSYLINQSEALTSLPALVWLGEETDVFFPPNGVLKDADAKTRDDEREASLEFYTPDGAVHDQLDFGLRIAGNNSGLDKFKPEGNWNVLRKRPQFNMFFRSEYGASSWKTTDFIPTSDLGKFDSIRVRSSDNAEHPFWIDEFVRRTHIRMGQVGAAGNFVNLFINGKFMTVLNPVERPREDWFQEVYERDTRWDILHVSDFVAGDDLFYREMTGYFQGHDFSVQANYDTAVTQYLEPESFVDYMMAQIYLGTNDWPLNNKIAARERPSGRYRYIPWDVEKSMDTGRGLWPVDRPADYDVFDNVFLIDSPSQWAESRPYHLPLLFTRFHENPEFRMLWADRAQKHLFDGGALTDGALSGLWFQLSNLLAPISLDHFNLVYDNAIFTGWQDVRRAKMFEHMALHDLWPSTLAPVLTPNSGTISAGETVLLENPNASGTLYFTTDGTDPRLKGGAVSASAQVATVGSITVSETLALTTRVLIGQTWSPIQTRLFRVPLVPPALRVTELLFHPAAPSADEVAAGFTDQDQFEFIELANVGEERVDLSQVLFTEGIGFAFSEGTIPFLEVGERVLLASDLAAFHSRYGTDLPLAGAYTGKLRNSGEGITLSILNGEHIQQFRFDDKWYPITDGSGYSLEIVNRYADTERWNEAAGWRASDQLGGSPGVGSESQPTVRISKIMYHPAPVTTEEMGAGFGNAELFEYVELVNVGLSPVDLSDFAFTTGLSADFTALETLELRAGHRALLVADRAAFEERYGIGLPIVGEYSGLLANAGEQLVLTFKGDLILHDFSYDAVWHPSTAGGGEALRIIDPDGDLSLWGQSVGWQADESGPAQGLVYADWVQAHFEDPLAAIAHADADADADGVLNLFEYAARTLPNDASEGFMPDGGLIPGPVEGAFVIRYRRPLYGVKVSETRYQAGDLTFVVESAESLESEAMWTEEPALWVVGSRIDNADGTETVDCHLDPAMLDSEERLFARVRLILDEPAP